MVPSQRGRAMKVWLVLGAGLVLALGVAPARADDRASARPLFDEGKRLMAEGKVSDACAKFEAASHLISTAGVRLNLAACWAKLGRTASAWAMYDEARTAAEHNGDAAAAEFAQKGKVDLEPRLTRLVVTVAAANAAGLAVTRDGEPVYSGAWGVGLPVDPGEHEIAAHASGRKSWSMKVTVVGEGASGSVTVPVLEPESGSWELPAPTGSAASAPAALATSAGGMTTMRTLGLVSGGVGVVGVGVGIVFAVLGSAANSSQQTDCPSPTNCPNHAQAISDRSTFTTDTAVEITGFAVGGLLLATGVVLFVAGGTKDTKTGFFLSPAIAPGELGLTLHGGF